MNLFCRQFQNHFANFNKCYNEHLSSREENLDLISRFPYIVESLRKIPLPPCLLSAVNQLNSSQQTQNLLDWIMAKDSRHLDKLFKGCQEVLEKYNRELLESQTFEVDKILELERKPGMKEFETGERMLQLENIDTQSRKLADEQAKMEEALTKDQERVRDCHDPSVLEQMCFVHKDYLNNFLANHKQLLINRAKCLLAKDEISKCLHYRLKWLMFVQNSMKKVNKELICHCEILKRNKDRIKLIRQIYNAPVLYCEVAVEVIRRKTFSGQYSKLALDTSTTWCKIYNEETTRRSVFDAHLDNHFLRQLMPGLEDLPPKFATKCPDPFDLNLPDLKLEDIVCLREGFPEMFNFLRVEEAISASLSVFESCKTELVIPTLTLAVPKLEKSIDNVDETISKTEEEKIPLDLSSASVEIITKEESRLLQIEVMNATSYLSSSMQTTDRKDPHASVETSPETDEVNTDAFRTADFYIDDSMPSSMTEMASSKKLAELQGILQEKMIQLESKEREVNENKHCIEDLTIKLTSIAQSMCKLREVTVSSAESLRLENSNLQVDVNALTRQTMTDLGEARQSLAEALEKMTGTMSTLVQSKDAIISEKEFCLSEMSKRVDVLSAIEGELQQKNVEMCLKLEEKTTECQILNQEIISLKEECKTINQLVLENEVEMEKLKSEFDAELKKREEKLLEEHRNEVTTLIAEKERLTADVEALRSELLESASRMESEIRRELLEKHEKELEENKREMMNRLEEEKSEQMTELMEERDRLQKVNDEQMERFAVEKREEMKNFEAIHRQEMMEITERHRCEIQSYLAKREEDEEEINRLKGAIEDYDKLVHELRTENEDREKEIADSKQSMAAANMTDLIMKEQPEVMDSNTDNGRLGREADLKKRIDLTQSLMCGEEFHSLESTHDSRPTSPALSKEEDLNLQLRLNDYIPLQRHEQIVQERISELRAEHTAEIDKILEDHKKDCEAQISQLVEKHEKDKQAIWSEYKTELETAKQITFSEALNQAVAERDKHIETLENQIATFTDRSSSTTVPETTASSDLRFDQNSLEQELADARQMILQLQSQLRLPSTSMMQSCMGQSFLPISDSLSHDKMGLLEAALKNKSDENRKLREKIMDLSMSRSSRSLVQDSVSVRTCSESDVVLFVWDPTYNHYLAFLTPDCPMHFLHTDCLEALGLQAAANEPEKVKHWVVAEVVCKEFCQAKKVNNRFGVPLDTKFYRVRAKPWNSSQDATGTEKRAEKHAEKNAEKNAEKHGEQKKS